MTRSHIGSWVLGSADVGLLIGAVPIVDMQAAAQVDRSDPPPPIPGTVEP